MRTVELNAEYEAKMIKAGDDYARIEAKNLVLEEKIDILFKLGKRYIEEKSTNSMNQEITCENTVSPEIIDTSNNDDAGTSWSVN